MEESLLTNKWLLALGEGRGRGDVPAINWEFWEVGWLVVTAGKTGIREAPGWGREGVEQ